MTILDSIHDTGHRISPGVDSFLMRHGDSVTYTSMAVTWAGVAGHLPLVLAAISTMCGLIGAMSQIYTTVARLRYMRKWHDMQAKALMEKRLREDAHERKRKH